MVTQDITVRIKQLLFNGLSRINCSKQQTMGADLYLVGVNTKDNSIF